MMKKATMFVVMLFAMAVVLGGYSMAFATDADQLRTTAEIVAGGTVVLSVAGPVIRCALLDVQYNECDISHGKDGSNIEPRGRYVAEPEAGEWIMDARTFVINTF